MLAYIRLDHVVFHELGSFRRQAETPLWIRHFRPSGVLRCIRGPRANVPLLSFPMHCILLDAAAAIVGCRDVGPASLYSALSIERQRDPSTEIFTE